MGNKYYAKLIPGFKLISFLVVPVYAFLLWLFLRQTLLGFVFFLFVTTAAIERYWETYLSSKESHREKFHGDWTLAVMSVVYIILFFVFTTEFYFKKCHLNYSLLVAGIIMMMMSFRLRFWGMHVLGKQWAVHAVGAQKIRRIRLMKLGPYKYIRHPIYLGIILEVVGLPLIANSMVGIVYAILICIPIMVVRASEEERCSLRRFGHKYNEYINEADFLVPFKQILRLFRK